MNYKIIILFMIMYSILFPVDIEFSFGGGAGNSTEFSYVKFVEPGAWIQEAGSRIDSGV